MQACESAYSSWKFSGGFRTWVKMSLVKTKEEDGREAVEFRQEVGRAGCASHRWPLPPWSPGWTEASQERGPWGSRMVRRDPVPGSGHGPQAGHALGLCLGCSRSPPDTWAKQGRLHFTEQVARPAQSVFLAVRGRWPRGR